MRRDRKEARSMYHHFENGFEFQLSAWSFEEVKGGI